MPQSQVTKSNLAQGRGTPTTGGTSGTTPTNIPAAPTTWNFLSKTVNSISINVSNLNNSYIVGTEVEKYLGTLNSNVLTNFTGIDYCVVSDYSLGGVKLQMRTRAIPIAYYDFTAKRIVRIIRVDFDDVSNSSSACNATLQVQNSNGVYVNDTTVPASPVYAPANLCPSCTSMLTSTKVRLFRKELSLLKEVPAASIKLDSLYLSVDPNYSVTGSAGACISSQCVKKGFDCCLDNQCVKDGSARPAATTLYQSQWVVAEEEKLTNALAYINYPHIYYVCGTTVPPATSTGTTSGTTSGVDYDAVFAQLKKDYYCIEHIKSQATASPFHTEVLSASYTGTTDCLTANSEIGQTMYYKEVVKRLYSTCGCSQTTLEDMVASCPAYDYTVSLQDSTGAPSRIECYTPPNVVEVPNSQSVSVNSRSAPHRFFESINGQEKNIVGSEKTYTSLGLTYDYVQEGDAFEYLDDEGILPVQKNFSMNAILGQMTVSLDKALPAKAVDVEIDQVYMLSTTSGYYTPCPECARDSWITTFSAFPGTSQGVGLQAIGHNTERDSIGTNYTSGNYEDTIFGRACWIPPTMIPFTHQSKSTVQEQRLNRLQSQAALFVNGYQRDWYGFNKGALIGSFDGVTWFAVGKGRIVKATSKKLFLAINAPFADLATPSIHVVQVQNYDGTTQAATYDYHPEYHLSHPYQNEAGNCQAYHQCKTDTDCVTRLGWEYVCSDVKDMKTEWPVFDVNGNEKAGTSGAVTIDQILQQKKLATTSSLRCVYRGAGAPCIVNSASIPGTTSTDMSRRKNLTCAPNFYCASITSSGFSSKISRYGTKLENIPVAKNHAYGKDANILGRPFNYINSTGGTALPTVVSESLKANMLHYEPTLANSYTGLCQPGKKLPTTTGTLTNPYEQHKEADTSRRADYINQIGSCNSTFFNDARYTSCPTFNTDGNYEIFGFIDTTKTDWRNGVYVTGYDKRSRTQNACGLDALSTDAPALTSTADILLPYSPFKLIEGRPLNVANTITDPTLVRDACLRRAGAVCHTDLDCSPNKFHADQVDFNDPKYFGNEAEQNYYKEYLVCGQAEAKPMPSNATAFKTYDMSKNRCCREIGKDLTTYTPDTPESDDPLGDYTSATEGLITATPPGVDPKAQKRYSRFGIVENYNSSDYPALSGNVTRNVATSALIPTTNASTLYQWKTLGKTNSQTCCGGGFIRKFYDGTTDWTKNNRLFLDVNNFKCINSKTVLLTNPTKVEAQYNNAADVLNLVSRDFFNYCMDSTGASGSCAQYGIESGDKVVPPESDPYPTAFIAGVWDPDLRIDTTTNMGFQDLYYGKNGDVYFMPESADSDSNQTINFADTATDARRNITIKIPSFIPRKGFETQLLDEILKVKAVKGDKTFLANCTKSPLPSTDSKWKDLTPTDTDTGHCTVGNCCWQYDEANRILKVMPDNAHPWGGMTIGVQFESGGAGGPSTSVMFTWPVIRFRPGNDLYYLRSLGKLELAGIPQIGYEALYCSDDYNRPVPGIFKSSINSKATFELPNHSYKYGGDFQTTHHNLDFEPIFSANDFKCCSQLGKIVDKQDKCCSGHGKAFGNGSAFTCMLPPGTDLMVYFNRFVSNEGTDKDGPGGGLVDSDFDPRTGEPGLNWQFTNPIMSKSFDKIRALGNKYCDAQGTSKVRQGGAFGMYAPEPFGPNSNQADTFYTIVDSSRDYAQTSNAGATVDNGYSTFMAGLRWNHHLYCNIDN